MMHRNTRRRLSREIAVRTGTPPHLAASILRKFRYSNRVDARVGDYRVVVDNGKIMSAELEGPARTNVAWLYKCPKGKQPKNRNRNRSGRISNRQKRRQQHRRKYRPAHRKSRVTPRNRQYQTDILRIVFGAVGLIALAVFYFTQLR